MQNAVTNHKLFQKVYLEDNPEANFGIGPKGGYQDQTVANAYHAFKRAYKQLFPRMKELTIAKGPFIVSKLNLGRPSFTHSPYMHKTEQDAQTEADRLVGLTGCMFAVYGKISTHRATAEQRKSVSPESLASITRSPKNLLLTFQQAQETVATTKQVVMWLSNLRRVAFFTHASTIEDNKFPEDFGYTTLHFPLVYGDGQETYLLEDYMRAIYEQNYIVMERMVLPS